MAIRTVLGTIEAGTQGITLMHEHIFIDLRNKFNATQINQLDDPVTDEAIPLLRKNHRLLKDNLYLSDEKLALQELETFKHHGGGTIVEMSARGMGGQPALLKQLSQSSKVHIVASTGFYTEATYPSYIKALTVREIADLIIHDINEGIEDSGVCAGIIGEIGTSSSITDMEWRVLEGAVLAQRFTGAAISIHIDPWTPNGIVVAKRLETWKADLERVVIGHVDAVIDLEYCRTLLKTGCVIEFDNFAKNYQTPNLHFDSDQQRVQALMTLIEEGYEHQIAISTDICLKTDLYRYGGGGYGHIPRTIIPSLRDNGFPEKTIQHITIMTPARLLDF